MFDLASGYSQGGRKSSLGVSRLHGQDPFSNARSYFRVLVNNMQKKKKKKKKKKRVLWRAFDKAAMTQHLVICTTGHKL